MRTLATAESFAAPPRAAMYFWISSSAVCAVAGAETAMRTNARRRSRMDDMGK